MRQKDTIDVIDKTLRPLVGVNTIYKNSLIVLLDKPNEQQLSSYKRFKQGYPFLFEDNRIFELPNYSL